MGALGDLLIGGGGPACAGAPVLFSKLEVISFTSSFAKGPHGHLLPHRCSGGLLANVLRLIAACFAWAMLLASAPAYALVPKVSLWSGHQDCAQSTDKVSVARQSASMTYLGSCTAPEFASFTCTVTTNTSTQYNVSCSGFAYGEQRNGWAGAALKQAASCPANSTVSGSSCLCTSPYVENTAKTACVAPVNDCADLAGKDAGSKNWEGRTSSFTFCDGYSSKGAGKCLVTAARDISWEDPPGSAHWISQGQGTYTGGIATSCNGTGGDATTPANSTKDPANPSPDTPKPGEAAPAPCPTGQAPGTVNGTRICAPIGDDKPKESTDSKEETKANGDKVKTSESTQCNSGGSKCITDKTTCTTASGQSLQTCETTSTTQSVSSLCSSNAGSKQCEGKGEGTPSSFSGTCASGFKPVGDDAVINAMALEIYTQNCKINPDTDSQLLAKAEMVKTGDQTLTNPNNSTVNLSSSNFDTSNALGGASSCPADRNVALPMGRSFTLKMSSVCGSLEMLGLVMLGFSFLLGARIVARG